MEKKITLFIATMSSGGAEHQLSILARGLLERGYDVTLVTFGSAEDHYALPEGIHRLRLRHNGRSVSKLFAIYGYFFRVRTNCVISFGARENFFCLIPLLFRPKIKVLAGERGVSFKGLTFYKKVNYSFLYKRANYIVPNSFSQRDEIVSIAPKYDTKIKVITNYTDINTYNSVPKEESIPLRIGVFARYSEQKNYRRFAKVTQSLKASAPIAFHIDWYGNQRKGVKETNPDYLIFEGLVKMYEIEDVLSLHDHIKDVDQVMPSYDMLCLPSLAEGFSNSISEYICCGRPVLASNVADNPVMVHDGVNGFLFDPMDEENMLRVFQKFLALSPEIRLSMGHKSRSIAESLFDYDKFINSYVGLIEA